MASDSADQTFYFTCIPLVTCELVTFYILKNAKIIF